MFSFMPVFHIVFLLHHLSTNALVNRQMSTPETGSHVVVYPTNPELMSINRPGETLNGSVYWIIITVPAVFGEAVQLRCHLNPEEIPNNRTIQWSRGKDHRLLVMNGISINETKYKVAFDSSSNSSVLTIRKFDLDDVNIPYECQHGFETYENCLKLVPSHFEYIPERNKTLIHQQTGIIFVSVTFDRVYPVPVCTALYGRENITDMITIKSVPNGSIYAAEINIKYHRATTKCFMHPIQLICLVGTKRISHHIDLQKADCSIDQSNNDTTIQNEKSQTFGELGRGIFTIVFTFYLAVFATACVISS